jgi:predicted dehydrogenase
MWGSRRGYFGKFHAEKYARIPEVNLVGVLDINPERAREVAEKIRPPPFSTRSSSMTVWRR